MGHLSKSAPHGSTVRLEPLTNRSSSLLGDCVGPVRRSAYYARAEPLEGPRRSSAAPPEVRLPQLLGVPGHGRLRPCPSRPPGRAAADPLRHRPMGGGQAWMSMRKKGDKQERWNVTCKRTRKTWGTYRVVFLGSFNLCWKGKVLLKKSLELDIRPG